MQYVAKREMLDPEMVPAKWRAGVPLTTNTACNQMAQFFRPFSNGAGRKCWDG
jgi:hypothetical protein